MSALGQKADILGGLCDVRFTPESGHQVSALGCPLCAKSGHWSPHRRGRSRTSRWSNGVADVPRRYWNLIKLDFERTERIRDGICKRGGRADRATFPDTLNAERIERRW